MQQGFCYPTAEVPPFDPKHNFLIDELFNGDFAKTSSAVQDSDSERLILSNEAISICLYDFEQANIDQFLNILDGRELAIVLCLRRDDAWLNSLYRQCLLNPDDTSKINAIGKSLEEFSRLERVKQLMDYDALLDAVRRRFRPSQLISIDYGENAVADFLRAIGASAPESYLRDLKNQSLPGFLIPVVAKVNSAGFAESERFSWLALIMSCFGVDNINLAHYRAHLQKPENLRAIYLAIGSGFLDGIDIEYQAAIRSHLEKVTNDLPG